MSSNSRTKIGRKAVVKGGPERLKIVKKDDITHCIDRPDMYIGSIESEEMEQFVVVNDEFKIEKQYVVLSPGILRIFIEPLSNIIDNFVRSRDTRKMTRIDIDIDEKTGAIMMKNDGQVIPIEKHTEEKCYNHTLVFGHFRTSTNYNDEEDRTGISGRNGIGVSACNAFSSYFHVEGVDPNVGKYFSQIWRRNMRDVSPPEVKRSKEKGYTKITFIPDFARFGIDSYSEDILSLYRKYIVDVAMVTRIPVYLNDTLIQIRSLADYAQLYSDETKEVLHIKTKDSEVVLMPSFEFQAISFANGVCTPKGGTHVKAWSEKLFRPILEKVNKPKQPQLTLKEVKNCFRLFVSVNVKNPTFESQSKEILKSPTVEALVKKSHISALLKWSIMGRLEDIIRAKEFTVLKKAERKKKGFTKVEGLDSANKEGGKYANECTLILVEGLSAKAYAVKGIEIGVFGKEGRDWFGIYPLRGKCLNCMNASLNMITKNAIVTNIIKALNLRYDIDYTEEKNFKTLRYGRVLLLCDSDNDGIHISGLVQNLFYSLFPSLLQRKDPFIVSMQTPIVRLTIGRRNSMFYDENEYRKYIRKILKNNPKTKFTYKYYKGLGTSDNLMIKETFGKKLVEYIGDEKISLTMNKVFNKKFSDSRKEWLKTYNPKNVKLTWKGENKEIKRLKISDFIDTELIKFSLADCKRSIPHVMDGLKESQRKILYVAFKKKLNYGKKEMKVAQFGAQVALHSGYHHGEQNLYDTLVKMAQSFPSSNNIPLFTRGGQFGTRLEGGKDHASPRYIYTKLDRLTRLLYNIDDDELLNYLEDDGDPVEPEFYVPLLPMVLINGVSAGIGTGWSCTIPSYNPLDMINCIKIWLECDGKVLQEIDDTIMSDFPDIHPWYRGWTGEIKDYSESKYITYGNVEELEENRVAVTELPINVWTNNFTSRLDTMKEEKAIVRYSNYSTPTKIRYEIEESLSERKCNIENLKLKSYLYTTNMVLFTNEGLRKFESVDEIIDYFCTIKYDYYGKRKKNILEKLEKELTLLGNKKRFMIDVIDQNIILYKKDGKKNQARPIDEIIYELEERKYDKIFRETKNTSKEESADHDGEHGSEHGYEYLLRMQFLSITKEKISKLENDISSLLEKRNELSSTTEKEMWLKELEIFEEEYLKFEESLQMEDDMLEKSKKKGRKKK